MKKIFFTMLFLGICSLAQAVTVTVTLTDEEYKAMSVLSVTPEEWIQHAASNKARKMIDTLANDYSEKKVDKMSTKEKRDIINSIDIAKEKEKRHGQ